MGMFDEIKTFSEEFQEDQPFDLQDARIGAKIQTDFGFDAPVQLKINGKWFSIFGQGLVNQVGRMEPGDLPCKVQLSREKTRSGQEVKLLIPVKKDDVGTA